MKKISCILSFLLCLGAPMAYPQTISSLTASVSSDSLFESLSMEEILVTSNRVKTSALLSPNKVQVLNEIYISRLNGGKLSDALSFSDAVFIKDYGFNSGLKTISMNSTQSEHTLILLDGIKLNSQQNSQFDLGLLQLDEVSTIEISKGGASSLYGTDAVGGVVSITTKKNKSGKPISFEIKSDAGSYGVGKIYLKAASQLKTGKNSSLNLSSSYSNEIGKNNFEFIFNNGFSNVRRERENSEYKTHSYNINLNFGLNKSSGLKLFALYNFWDRNLAGVELGYSSAPSRQIDRDFFSSMSFNKTFNPSTELSANLYYKYSLMNYSGPQNLSPPLAINSFYKLNSYNNSTELKYSYPNKYDLTLGYEISYNTISSNETEKGKLLQPSFFIAGKLELENSPLSKISLYPSLRYDYYSNINEHVLSGKMGVNIKPFDRVNMSFKSSAGNNFRAPTFNDLYWIGLGNKNLLPERSLSFDCGVYFRFNLLGDNQLEFSYFNISAADRILWKPDQTGIWRPANIGKVKSEGIDFSFKSLVNLLKYFSAGINFNYNYATSLKKNQDFNGDNTYDKQLIYIPQEYAKSSLMLNYIISDNLVKQISLNVFYTFTGKRYVNLENTRFLPYYELIDANINVILSIFKVESSLKFAVNNITNTDYQVISGYPMPLRNYKIQVGFKY